MRHNLTLDYVKQMDAVNRTLPDFDNPPVIETVMDVSFAPLVGWGIPHFGLFWNEIKSEYPEFADQQPIQFQPERFGEEAKKPATITFEFAEQPQARCWFIHNSASRLIQVQNDKFIHNWRKRSEGENYPRYDEAIRPAFEAEWSRFCGFLNAESIATPEVRQCEISYINHIELNKGWITFVELIDALSNWPGGKEERFLPLPETMVVNTSYLMPNNEGRLRIQIQPAIRHSDLKQVIQLSLIAKGRPASSETRDILRWFDLGREWIVRGFTDFTSAKMHEIWQRRA